MTFKDEIVVIEFMINSIEVKEKYFEKRRSIINKRRLRSEIEYLRQLIQDSLILN